MTKTAANSSLLTEWLLTSSEENSRNQISYRECSSARKLLILRIGDWSGRKCRVEQNNSITVSISRHVNVDDTNFTFSSCCIPFQHAVCVERVSSWPPDSALSAKLTFYTFTFHYCGVSCEVPRRRATLPIVVQLINMQANIQIIYQNIRISIQIL